jgi:hypothetical protein
VITLLLAATQTLVGLWSYSAFDSSGYKIAHGTITLRPPTAVERKEEPKKGTYFLGSKKITCVNLTKYGSHGAHDLPTDIKLPQGLKTDVVFAEFLDGKIHLDLSYGWFDDNIWLTGDFAGGSIRGTWEWATESGIRNRGKFSMSRIVNSATKAAPKR